MVEKLLDCNFLEFSTPINNDWVIKLQDYSKVYIIGNGVTAVEYSHILNNFNILFEFVEPKIVFDNIDYLRNGYSIVACYHDFKKIISILDSYGFVRGKNYDTFYVLLRNRAVFDFRKGRKLDSDNFKSVVKSLRYFKTVAGIDVFINASDIYLFDELVIEVLKNARAYFHVKVSIELDCKLDVGLYNCFYSDLIEVIVRKDCYNLFNHEEFDLLCTEQHNFKQAHVIYIDCDKIKGDNFSSDQQINHPQYYDEHLLISSEIDGELYQINRDNELYCLSRRMFPVFDERLNLKLCSLFDSVARTELCLDAVFSCNYINKRNKLCELCRDRDVYRIK